MAVKNIVLLSDGTGNSSDSTFKSNVWRLYQAVDRSPPAADSGHPDQLVYYDNGVGTESFRPLAAIGGAFGIGVWQNVKDLYTFVCRNYQPGDYIFGFGFSRGAFTIRLLMGMIGKCGIVKTHSEAHLIECVEAAYEAYRRDFLLRASRNRMMIYHLFLREPKYRKVNGKPGPTIELGMDGCEQFFPDIRFLGVWDTVDAYGMPVEELKLAIDDYIWPMSFADRDPSPRLLTIRHALSLDDERPTFRPVLWNEVLPKKEGVRDKEEVLTSERIQQVWFAGVHANVGGGYPDDGLAVTALQWMMDAAELKGLRYDKWATDMIKSHVNPDAEHYDSRTGIAGYYRYGPRQVGALSKDPGHGVDIPTVRVHKAAYERIAAWRRAYQPVSLDCAFSVDGAGQAAADPQALQNAWDIVWWRRGAYFATLALSAFMALFFLRAAFEWPKAILSVTEGWLMVVWRALAKASPGGTNFVADYWFWGLGHIEKWLPGWLSPIVPALRDYSLSGIVALVLLGYLFYIASNQLDRRIEVLAEWAWRGHKHLPAAAQPTVDWRNHIARALRPLTLFFYAQIWRRGVVLILGLILGVTGLAVAILLSPFWIWGKLRTKPWMA